MFKLIPQKAIVFYSPDIDTADFEGEDGKALFFHDSLNGYPELIFIHDLNKKGNPISTIHPTKEAIQSLFNNNFQMLTEKVKRILSGGSIGNVLGWSLRDYELYACWYEKGGVRKIATHQGEHDVFFPLSVFILKGRDMRIFTVKGLPKKESMLYTYSLPHLNIESGSLCLGSTSISINKVLEEEKDIVKICNLISANIFNAKWTHDTSKSWEKVNKLSIEKRKYVGKLKKHKRLYEEAKEIFGS